MSARNVILMPRYETKDLPKNVANVWPVRETEDEGGEKGLPTAH
jgi:hypothetical protein